MEVCVVGTVLLLLSGLIIATDLQWKPLESIQNLQDREFALTLAAVPWCGESRSFMNEFTSLVKQKNNPKLEALQLHYISTHKDKSNSGTRSLTLTMSGSSYTYMGIFSADHVYSSVEYALGSYGTDIPYHLIQSCEELSEFVESTDRAFVLVDFCSWTIKDRIIEDYQEEQDGFYGWSYERTNQSCSLADEKAFNVFYRNLTEYARAYFLTPYKARFGVIRSPQILEDAKVSIPSVKPWFLMVKSQGMSRSWRFLTDESQLNEFLEHTVVLVDEVKRDTQLPNNRPSVLLFINRGSSNTQLRDESRQALHVIREVARHYANTQLNTSITTFKKICTKEDLPVFHGKTKTLTIHHQGELNEGLAGLLSNSAETLLQMLLQDSNKKNNLKDFSEQKEDEEHKGEYIQVTDEESTETLSSALLTSLSNKQQEPRLVITKSDMQDQEQFDSCNVEEEYPKIIEFGYMDGADSLRELITGRTNKKPSLVVLFPHMDKYYVFQEDIPMSFASVVEFIDGILSGSVPHTLRTAQPSVAPREPVRPPFVNLDFHRINSIPYVTLNTFSERVLDQKNSRNTIVFFTLPSCGFCQKMELAVQAIHRYFIWHVQPELSRPDPTPGQKGEDLPVFYQMDCTMNDCSHIFANISEVEEYPSLVLFRARHKDAPLLYKSAPSIKSILNFLATSSPIEGSSIRIESGRAYNQRYGNVQLEPVRIGVGNILVASEKLSNISSVFEGAIILLTSVSEEDVTGIIINKATSWEHVNLSGELNVVKTAYLGYGGPIYEKFYSITKLQGLTGFTHVAENLYVGDPTATQELLELIEQGKIPASGTGIFVGRCGWFRVQLLQELAAGFWRLSHYQDYMFPSKP